MKKLSNSGRTLKVLEKLRMYSSEDNRLTATDINRFLAEDGYTKTDRKTIYEDFKIIEEAGFNIIKNKKTIYLDGNPFTYYEVKLLTDAVNSLSFLNSKDKQAINNKIYQSIDLNHIEFLKKYEFNGTSNKESRPYYFLETIYQAIFNERSIFLTNRRSRKEIIPYTCIMNSGFYYLVYQYPETKKLYTQRFDRIKKVEEGNKCDDDKLKRLFDDKEVKKYLKQSVGSYHSDTVYRLEIEVLNKEQNDRIIDVLSTDFNNTSILQNRNIMIDVIDAPTTYANLLKLGTDIRIVLNDEYKIITDNYKNILKDTLNLY